MTQDVAEQARGAQDRGRPTRSTPPRALLRLAGHVLGWVVILAGLAVLAVAVVVPRLAGATPYAVLTGSMQPDLPPGTLVVTRPVPFEALRPGQVVTYQLWSGRPAVVTHRLVQSRTDLTGRTEWQTRGDANDAPDERWVQAEQVRGVLWYAVPQVGRAEVLLTGRQHQLLVYGAAALLASYAGSMFAGAARERRRDRRAAAVRAGQAGHRVST